MPTINYKHTLSQSFSLSGSSEFRFSDNFSFVRNANLLIGSYVINDIMLLETGYQHLILNNEENQHRFRQSFSVDKDNERHDLSHRIKFDETFSANIPTVIRARYRLTNQFTLQKTANQQERFINTNIEIVNKLQNSEYELELRFVPSYNFQFLQQDLDLGFDSRLTSVFSDNNETRVWLVATIYFND